MAYLKHRLSEAPAPPERGVKAATFHLLLDTAMAMTQAYHGALKIVRKTVATPPGSGGATVGTPCANRWNVVSGDTVS